MKCDVNVKFGLRPAQR